MSQPYQNAQLVIAARRRATLPKLHPLAVAVHIALFSLGAGTGSLTLIADARAEDATVAAPARKSYNIPSGPLATTLNQFAQQSGLILSYDPALAAGSDSKGLTGDYSVSEGLNSLLAGTGLASRFTNANTVTLERSVVRREEDPNAATTLPTVTVSAERDDNLDVDEGFKAEYQTSATKTPLSIRETPQSISVITQDSLEARQVISIGQALETAAGVVVSEPGPFAGRNPFGGGIGQIRGIEANLFFDVREDGFLAPRQFGDTDLAPYERVEVIKGPNSTLYGRGSAGGLLNLVTTKKPLPEFKAEIAPTLGSFDFYRLDADVTGPLFESDKARGRLVLAYEDAGSFVDGAESERTVVAPSLEFDLTDSTRLLLLGTYQDDRQLPHYGVPLLRDGEDFRAPDVRRSFLVGLANDDLDDVTSELLSGSAQIEQQLGDDWLATLRFNRTDSKLRVNSDSYGYGLTPIGDTSLYSTNFDTGTDVWSGEIRLSGKVNVFGQEANLTLGADRNELDYYRFDGGYVLLGTANIYEENFADFPTATRDPTSRADSDFENTGVYGQVQLRPVERLSFLLGGRYDWAETSRTETTLGDAPTVTTKNETTDEEFTWRAGLTFDVSDPISIYGLYAQSFTPNPGFIFGRDGLLDAETGEIYELGVKSEWLSGKLGINAAIFRIDRDNTPIRDPTNSAGESFSVAAGLQRAEGLELEVNGEPFPGWNVSFGGILLDSEFVERDDPNFGNAPQNAADWQVGLFTSYELQSGPLKGLGFGAGLFAIDQRPVGADSPGTIDGYERVDLQVFYNGFEDTKIALQVRNVFDEEYIESLGTTNTRNYFGAPTAVLLTVRTTFGK